MAKVSEDHKGKKAFFCLSRGWNQGWLQWILLNNSGYCSGKGVFYYQSVVLSGAGLHLQCLHANL